MRRTKIICTIGPATNNKDILKEMILAGMNVARFNMSHGDHESHLALIKEARLASEELNMPLAILIDTKGPEIRIGKFAEGYIELEEGSKFTLTTKSVVGNAEKVSVTYAKLPQEVKKGTRILIDDGAIELSVINVTDTDIVTKVVVGGKLSNKKSVNVPAVDIDMPYLSEQDKKDIQFACEVDADYLAISFVRDKSDVLSVRRLLEKFGKPNIKIISKIECEQGVRNAHEIIEHSNGLMVARGDLGVEVDFAQIPIIQKQLISECNTHGKIVITATQMMESMLTNNRPTRAEISDVANAICDGTTAVMLSGETSAGKHPTLVVKTMAKIAQETELTQEGNDFAYYIPENMSLSGSVGYGVCALKYAIEKCVIVCLDDYEGAISISNYRPATDIFFFTTNKNHYNQASLYNAIEPIYCKKVNLNACVNYLFESGLIAKNTNIIVVCKNNISVIKN